MVKGKGGEHETGVDRLFPAEQNKRGGKQNGKDDVASLKVPERKSEKQRRGGGKRELEKSSSVVKKVRAASVTIQGRAEKKSRAAKGKKKSQINVIDRNLGPRRNIRCRKQSA